MLMNLGIIYGEDCKTEVKYPSFPFTYPAHESAMSQRNAIPPSVSFLTCIDYETPPQVRNAKLCEEKKRLIHHTTLMVCRVTDSDMMR
jgi:hypothetical protein